MSKKDYWPGQLREATQAEKQHVAEEISKLSKYCNERGIPFIGCSDLREGTLKHSACGPVDKMANMLVNMATVNEDLFNTTFSMILKAAEQAVFGKKYG